jgi:hypothetical protein
MRQRSNVSLQLTERAGIRFRPSELSCPARLRCPRSALRSAAELRRYTATSTDMAEEVGRADIDNAIAALEARDGPFAVDDAVTRAVLASGWDPAGDGNPLAHAPGLSMIVEANVQAERDLAVCLRDTERSTTGKVVGPVDSYRPLARCILAHVISQAAPAV